MGGTWGEAPHDSPPEWQLSLREVEERSLCLAQEKRDRSYQVSASWLDRLEREEHELTVSKLMALAEIYGVSTDQLLRSVHPESGRSPNPGLLSSPNTTMLPSEGPISRSIIEAHSGRLWAGNDRAPQGAAFHFSLPAIA